MTKLQIFKGASAWRGPEMAASDNWIYELSKEEIQELKFAGGAVKNREIIDLQRADFTLPLLNRLLTQIFSSVADGCGFSLLRGLLITKWSLEHIAYAYWAIGSRIGVPVSQNRVDNLLSHVTDVGDYAHHPNQRGHQSADALSFHTDIGAEIVGLLCLNRARFGGASSLVSAATLWNELVIE